MNLRQWLNSRSIQQKITLAYGVAFSTTVLGSILGFTLSKQDERSAFLGQSESIAQLVLINDVKSSVIELLIHQDELLDKASDDSADFADLQSTFAHFAEDYRVFEQNWELLSQVYSLDRTGETAQATPTAYAADTVVSLAAHHDVVADYAQEIKQLTQQLETSPQSRYAPVLYERLTQVSQSYFVAELESFLTSIAQLERSLQQEHSEATALLKQATALQIRLTIASIILSGGIGILLMDRFSHMMLSPLQQITRVTQQSIRAGQFDLQLPVRNRDEIGLLGETLNLYVHKLKASQSELLKEEHILQRQSATLAKLSQSKAVTQGHLPAAFQELTSQVAELLQVERVSIWLLDSGHNTGGYSAMHCVQLFQRSQQSYSNGELLTSAGYPSYFEAIAAYPILSVDDAGAEPRTRELKADYLDRFDIRAMLSARFDVDGQHRGVVCCEQVGGRRGWSPAEQNLAHSVANLVSLAIEASQYHQKAQQLERALTDLKQSQFQIIQSEKMAVLGQLTSGIAHEINNPVSFIYGNLPYAEQYVNSLIDLVHQYQTHYPQPPAAIAQTVESIDLDFLQEDLGKLLQSMQVGSERIHRIVKSMGHFSRMDDTERQEVDIHVGLDNTLLLLNTRLRAQHWRPAIR